MTTATLSRGGTSVTFQIWEEGGELLVARDIGKPQGGVKTVSREDPRTSDNMSALDRLTVVGRLEGANAYSDAQTLAEDLVKPYSNGNDLTLDLSAISGYSTYTVGVPSDRALELDYRPGVVDVVDLQLGVPIVSTTLG